MLIKRQEHGWEALIGHGQGVRADIGPINTWLAPDADISLFTFDKVELQIDVWQPVTGSGLDGILEGLISVQKGNAQRTARSPEISVSYCSSLGAAGRVATIVRIFGDGNIVRGLNVCCFFLQGNVACYSYKHPCFDWINVADLSFCFGYVLRSDFWISVAHHGDVAAADCP